MDSVLTQNAHFPSADPLPEYKVFRETMDGLLAENAHLPSADPLPEKKGFCGLAAMRQVLEPHLLEPHLLRIESEIRSIVNASFSMQETLERIEQQQSLILVRSEGKSVCDIDDHSHYLLDVKRSVQPLGRPYEEFEDRSMQRGFLDMQSALVKNVDGSIDARGQPTSVALDDIKTEMARPPMETDHVRGTDKLIVDHDEPKAVTPVVNQEEILNALRAECQVDLPDLQEYLKQVLREEFRHHEVSMFQQLTELQNCAKPVMNQPAKGENQQELLMKCLAPGALMNDAGELTAVTPVVNQEVRKGLRAEHVQLQLVGLPNFQESLRKVLREEFRHHEVSMVQQLMELQNCAEPEPAASMITASDKKLNEDDQRCKCSDEQATLQNLDENEQSPSVSPVTPEVKVPTSAQAQKSAHTGFLEAQPRKRQGPLKTFDQWFSKRFSAKASLKEHDLDASNVKIPLGQENSFAGVFVLDRNLEKVPYRTEDFFKSTGCVQALVRSDWFQNLTVIVVCVNALWVGFAQDRNREVKLYSSRPVFIIFETFFCTYFTLELVLRFFAFASAREAFRDGWFRFDFFLVTTMILDTWVIMVVMQIMDGRAVLFPTAPFRMLRLLKLTRMARLMHAFPELITMVRSMIRAVRAVASMCILVTLLIYMWAIIMNTLLREETELNVRLKTQSQMDFSTVRNSMWILFLNGALLLDNSAPLLTQLVFGDSTNLRIAGSLVLVFVFLTYFLVLQMLTGIFCDVVIQVREEHRNEHDVRLIKQELTVMLKRIDDGDGMLTQAEVLEFINKGNTKAVLRQMGINLMFLFQLQEIMFDRQSRIKLRDFLELMLLCRSSNHATVETIAGGFCFIGKEIERLEMHLMQGTESTKEFDEMEQYAKQVLLGDGTAVLT